MATWTHLLASSAAGSTVRHVCSSGTRIYYVDDSTEDVYEYDPDTNTETLIIDASAITDYNNTYAITWFNDALYVMNDYGLNDIRVERWDGTPNDLTTVRTFTLDGGTTQTGMLSDDNTIVAFTVSNPSSPDPFEAECWYSSDGSSWSAGSWDNDVWSPPDLNGPFQAPRNTAFPTGLFREFVTETSLDRTDTTEKSIFRFTGGVWIKIAVLNTNPNEIYNFSSPNEGVHWTYTAGQYYTNDTFSATATISSSPRQTRQVNMPYSVAISLSFSPAPELYQYDTGAWVLLDTFSASWDLDSDSKALVRLDSGDVYMVAYSSIGAAYAVRIFGRDEPIEPGCLPAQFYYGIETPLYASDLPFCGVRPGGIAIAKSGLVILGSDARSEAGPSVIYGQYPYTGEWADISGIVPTGTAVTSIKFL